MRQSHVTQATYVGNFLACGKKTWAWKVTIVNGIARYNVQPWLGGSGTYA
jgi:hypothetical protein